MRILFIGAGALACPALKAIMDRGRDVITAVVTQPDRPRGRNLQIGSCPVKTAAESAGVPLLTPEDVNAADVLEFLARGKPDLLVVAAFGQFLKRPLLALSQRGAINIHPSLLPRYRGAAPIQWTLANGDGRTGVTILYVTPRMDAGDMILQEEEAVYPDDTAETLEARLAERGARMLLRAIDLFEAGAVTAVPQDESKVVLAPKLTKDDGRVDWRMPAAQIANRLRGFQPWPGCFCEVPAGSGKVLILRGVRVEEGCGDPGRILSLQGDGPLVAAGDKALRLLQVQPAGKRAMSGQDYLRGARLREGDVLG